MIEYWRVKAAARAFTASLRGIGSNLSALKRTENNNAANDSFNDFFFPSGYRLFNSRTLEECAFPSVGSNPYEDDFISPPPFEALSSPSLSTSSPSSSSSLSNSHTTLLETLTDASPNGEDSPEGTVVYIGSGGFIKWSRRMPWGSATRCICR
ncbi:hypothetical protein AGDE_13693 [Angomonas deanei]|uniref:Uncharacterized protein n=1 Tax=Angomonas deanei TaxID=59799 RepID=A0A7G2C1R6_9TRYP|nr:hypothetical protein AGDE_13693 [Angomonas deanei]CAD2213254.1 hypothetical protein, conserved [Angomonas deanei]|eukprot:EPY21870.1 hypothetical protein AGDE_13693 [Angomonas deanei]